jgi:hypothetical protein
MMPIEEMNLEELHAACPHLVPQHRPEAPEFWPFDYSMEQWKEDLKTLKPEYDEHHNMRP